MTSIFCAFDDEGCHIHITSYKDGSLYVVNEAGVDAVAVSLTRRQADQLFAATKDRAATVSRPESTRTAGVLSRSLNAVRVLRNLFTDIRGIR